MNQKTINLEMQVADLHNWDNRSLCYLCRSFDQLNHAIYSNNFILNVLDLTQIDLAAEEDKQFQIDYWAKLFKSNTWEELKAMATQNEYLHEASETIFTLSSDELVRKRCLDREAYYIDMKAMQEDIAEEKEKNAKLQEEIAEKDSTIAQQAAELELEKKQLAELQANSK